MSDASFEAPEDELVDVGWGVARALNAAGIPWERATHTGSVAGYAPRWVRDIYINCPCDSKIEDSAILLAKESIEHRSALLILCEGGGEEAIVAYLRAIGSLDPERDLPNERIE